MPHNIKNHNEFSIMIAIYTDLTNNLEHIKTSNALMKKVRHSIDGLNNNYFETHCNDEIFKHYLNMFEDVELYNELVYNLETLKTYLEEKLKNMCKHEWVCDLVDVSPDRSQHVSYCRLCEVTGK